MNYKSSIIMHLSTGFSYALTCEHSISIWGGGVEIDFFKSHSARKIYLDNKNTAPRGGHKGGGCQIFHTFKIFFLQYFFFKIIIQHSNIKYIDLYVEKKNCKR